MFIKFINEHRNCASWFHLFTSSVMQTYLILPKFNSFIINDGILLVLSWSHKSSFSLVIIEINKSPTSMLVIIIEIDLMLVFEISKERNLMNLDVTEFVNDFSLWSRKKNIFYIYLNQFVFLRIKATC